LGNDTSLLVGSQYALHFSASDKFGSIVKREINIAGIGFKEFSRTDTTLILPNQKGMLTVIGKATDDDGNVSLDTLNISAIYASENHLANLFISPPTTVLLPEFNPDSLSYSAVVENSTTSIVVGADALDKKNIVKINGTILTPTTLSVSISLKVGQNDIPILVYAQDSSIKTYTIHFTRKASNTASLTSLTLPTGVILSPVFSSSILSYSVTLPDNMDTLQLTPITTDFGATIKVNGVAVISASLSQKIPVAVGVTAVTLEVLAQNGAIKNTYYISCLRNPWQVLGTASYSPARTSFVTMIENNGIIYSAFVDSAHGNKALVMRRDIAGWTNLSPTTIPDSAALNIKLAMNGGIFYMGYHVVQTNYSYNLYVKKFVAGTWLAVGNYISLPPGTYDGVSFGFDKNGIVKALPGHHGLDFHLTPKP